MTQQNKSNNIVSEAHKHGLTFKQERFAQEIAVGATQCDAAKVAGYIKRPKAYNQSLPSRLIRDAKIQLRIQQIINEQDYESKAQKIWNRVLDADPSGLELGSSHWSQVIDKQIKIIDQIAKLGGWEPKQVEETRKLILKGSIKDLLPTDRAHEDASGSTIEHEPMSSHENDIK